MKYPILVISLACMISCKNNENSTYKIEAQKQVHVTPSYQNAPSDTGATTPPPKPQHESVFPAGKFNSLSEIMAYCFSEGSTKEEVRRVQGEPDFKEASYPLENWYYGNCLVQFNGPIVRAVKNTDSYLLYVDYFALAFSPDKIETEFYLLLNYRINRR